MTTLETSNTADLRTLNAREIDLVTGGVTDGGCIRLPDIIVNPLPPSTPPWFSPDWIRVGRTGTL
jgi:hypothetical protein